MCFIGSVRVSLKKLTVMPGGSVKTKISLKTEVLFTTFSKNAFYFRNMFWGKHKGFLQREDKGCL